MWKYSESKQRVEKQAKVLDENGITVKPLEREMNLGNLSLREARIVHGSHFYVDVKNFAQVVSNTTVSREDYKPLHRYLHALRLEQRHIVQCIFDGDKIQVQGQKFHGILYKPYDDDASLAWHSVLIALVITDMMESCLPEVFPQYPQLSPACGVSLGDALVANIGVRGDRELISVGSVANYAAKIIGNSGTVTVTKQLWDVLEADRKLLFTKRDDVYVLDRILLGDFEQLVAEEGFAWSRRSSVKRLQETVDAIPLSEINSGEAKVLIDPSSLGPRTMRVCDGGTVYVDIDGYTALVDSLLGDGDTLVEAVKLLHLFRYELQMVAQLDFDGIAIQHQGDRLQALIHLPFDDPDKIKETVAQMCVSFNSSVEQVLNVHFRRFDPYHVSIGADFGKTVVVRSGAKGDMDIGCLGNAVLAAEQLQLVTKGGEMRISKTLYAAIADEELRNLFMFDSKLDCYIASGATWAKVQDERFARNLSAGVAPVFSVERKGVRYDEKPSSSAPALRNTSNWGPDESSE